MGLADGGECGGMCEDLIQVCYRVVIVYNASVRSSMSCSFRLTSVEQVQVLAQAIDRHRFDGRSMNPASDLVPSYIMPLRWLIWPRVVISCSSLDSTIRRVTANVGLRVKCRCPCSSQERPPTRLRAWMRGWSQIRRKFTINLFLLLLTMHN